MTLTPELLLKTAIEPAMLLLPERMNSYPAKTFMLAIAMQESGLRHRRQIRGPARSLWQFEVSGVNGVDKHHASRVYAADVLTILLYDHDPVTTHAAIEHNDVLAAAYARLLLWRYPAALPDGRMDVEIAWRQYLSLWRPRKPKEKTWEDNYTRALRCVI